MASEIAVDRRTDHSPTPSPGFWPLYHFLVADNGCLSCAVVSGRSDTLGGTILETDLFHLHQDVAYPIDGLVIVALKRHVYCLDELSETEAVELMDLLRRVRAAQRQALGIEHVYYFYNEDTTHHFHIWMVPRYEWMKQFGRSVQSLRPVLHFARDHMQDSENIAKVIQSVGTLRTALAPT